MQEKLKELDCAIILKKTNVNVSHSAELAGISRRTLQRKMKELGIDKDKIKKTLRRSNGKT